MQPLLIDCDPGLDDAAALALAWAAPELSIEAVTTVAGNQTLEKTTRNARAVLEAIGCQAVSVSPGLASPLLGQLAVADEVHGQSGIGGLELPAVEGTTRPDHAVDRLWKVASTLDQPVLAALGPLTNLAVCLRRYPELPSVLEQVVIMGGAIADGNVTPVAEFNVHTDPEAARIVFESDLEVTMVGLDVTRAARVGDATRDRLLDRATREASLVADVITELQPLHSRRDGWETVPLHDALAIASLIDPSLLETEPMAVSVETRGEFTTGMTVCERCPAGQPTAQVATGVDADGFRDRLCEVLGATG